mgnify:CR=1 FL=1
MKLFAAPFLLCIAGFPAASQAEEFHTHVSWSGEFSTLNCEAGHERFVSETPLKFETGELAIGEWHKASLRYQYMLWLHANHRQLLTQVARQAGFHHSRLQIAETPAEATSKTRQYGAFTPYDRCNGRVIRLPTDGFAFEVLPYGTPRGGVGQAKYDMLNAFFEANSNE